MSNSGLSNHIIFTERVLGYTVAGNEPDDKPLQTDILLCDGSNAGPWPDLNGQAEFAVEIVEKALVTAPSSWRGSSVAQAAI